ncbi:MAG: UvrD-helicase domain-containing protein [Rhodoferax sp.]|uniref:UvrD-helicase domain-containing protein n=1 Tax=Rhodoferax sp. TaxID=50421 RepID=UPI00179B351D|nr:UvrD-helicase domain-containing protein [Rhodoferax sp.]NMM12413.1 UvrD-helicase domain-containing protein [Rhodoferax sp.]
MKPLIFISLEAIGFMQIYGPPPAEWYVSFDSELLSVPTYISECGDVLILTYKEALNIPQISATALICVNGGFLGEIVSTRKPEAFNRILRIAQSVIDQGISIPSLWKPYNADSLLTVQASPRSTGERARILFDRRIQGNVAGICYGVVSSDVDILESKSSLINPEIIEARFSALKISADEHGIKNTEEDIFNLEVNNKILGLGDSLKTWYDSKLTLTQRRFVDFQLTKSIRIRGPAGTGKTIALVVKLLRQLQSDKESSRPMRYALLTHSEATVEVIWSMIRTMLPGSEMRALTNSGNLLLGTLYSLAFDTLGTELRGVNPLSLDGRSGREMQRELLTSIFKNYANADWLARKGGCSEGFIEKFEAAVANEVAREQLILEILNEFACVLEPEGTSRSARKKEEYISKMAREPWRLKLSQPDERRVILDLHSNFRKEMRDMEVISVDQLISDFDRFLDSNAWDITRATVGFDAIFVDELHLLNRMERMLITSLVKDPNSRPLVVMAEDVKQDLKRISAGMKSWQAQFDGLTDFALDEVFRYTPEINAFLRAIDEFSPTLNLGEDWPIYQQQSKLPSGAKPDFVLHKTVRAQYDLVFERAEISAKKRKSGRAVAVLTCDYQNFKQYLLAGQYRDAFVPVESREDITAIPNRGTKFILSMPEFVAGLQFDEVYLIDVSENVFNSGESVGVSDRRRGLSMAYLGGSRAMKVLHVSGLTDAGGAPAFIKHAVQAKAITHRTDS